MDLVGDGGNQASQEVARRAARHRAAGREVREAVRRNVDRTNIVAIRRWRSTRWRRRPCRKRRAEERNNPAALLLKLKGLGPEFASLLWLESLFRNFGNRRQVAAYSGSAPSPWQSGGVERDQGISKSGNRRLRKTMIELAWFWLRHQPDTARPRINPLG